MTTIMESMGILYKKVRDFDSSDKIQKEII